MTRPFWRKPLSVLLALLLLIESVYRAIMAFILPSKPKPTRRTYRPYDYSKKPTGYKCKGVDGKWHIRYWVYDKPH